MASYVVEGVAGCRKAEASLSGSGGGLSGSGGRLRSGEKLGGALIRQPDFVILPRGGAGRRTATG